MMTATPTQSPPNSTPNASPGSAPETFEPKDLHHSPFLVFYETTRACDLSCKHCRACAQPDAHPSQLSTQAACAMFEQLARFPKKPLLVLTGGDPLKRPDIYPLIRHAREVGLTVAMTPSATPLVTKESIRKLKEAGVSRIAFSLDSATAAGHDTIRGVDGIYAQTLEMIGHAVDAGLPVQINTTITQRNVAEVDQIAELIDRPGVVLWSVFFLVPVGRGLAEQTIAPDQYEEVFARLWHHATSKRYGVKTTEAHHYRRFVLQQMKKTPGNAPTPTITPGGVPGRPDSKPTGPDATGAGRRTRPPVGISDGKGVMFISHVGDVYPSGFLPMRCGRFPKDNVVDVYQNHPLFLQLRDPDGFSGKCGVCEYRQICGGSRARAYAVERNPLASEPDCVHIPSKYTVTG